MKIGRAPPESGMIFVLEEQYYILEATKYGLSLLQNFRGQHSFTKGV